MEIKAVVFVYYYTNSLEFVEKVHKQHNFICAILTKILISTCIAT